MGLGVGACEVLSVEVLGRSWVWNIGVMVEFVCCCLPFGFFWVLWKLFDLILLSVVCDR